MSAVILFAIRLVMGLRVTEEEEMLGLDQAQHAEIWYEISTSCHCRMNMYIHTAIVCRAVVCHTAFARGFAAPVTGYTRP